VQSEPELERQLPEPLQTKALTRVDPEQLAAEHSLWGSVPLVIGLQVPEATPVSAMVQAWQVPPQALPQQTPSVQKVLLHWSPPAQAAPGLSLSTQTLEPLQ